MIIKSRQYDDHSEIDNLFQRIILKSPWLRHNMTACILSSKLMMLSNRPLFSPTPMLELNTMSALISKRLIFKSSGHHSYLIFARIIINL